MAEIILDNNRIDLSTNHLKLYSFLAELQKKTKQYIYLVNNNEIGVFDNLDNVKKGMWRRFKTHDSANNTYFYIDQDTHLEHTVFCSEFAIKLGNVGYEPPPKPKISPNQSSVPTQTPTQSAGPVASASMLLPEDMSFTTVNTSRAPVYPQYNPNSMIIGNYSFVQPDPQNSKKSQKISTKNMSSKSIQNLNRILAYTTSKQTDVEQTPIVNSWMQTDTRYPSNKSDQTPIVNSWMASENRIKNDQAIINGWNKKDSKPNLTKNTTKSEPTTLVNNWMQSDVRFQKQTSNTQNSSQQTSSQAQNSQTPHAPQQFNSYSQYNQQQFSSFPQQQFTPYTQNNSTQQFTPQPTQFTPQPTQQFTTQPTQQFTPQPKFNPQQFTPQPTPQFNLQPQQISQQFNLQTNPSSSFSQQYSNQNGYAMNMMQQVQQPQGQQLGQPQTKPSSHIPQNSDPDESRYRYFGPPQKKKSGVGSGNVAPQTVESKFTA